jgi:hypothetical protein
VPDTPVLDTAVAAAMKYRLLRACVTAPALGRS